jgi:hypothetical protein
MMICGAQRADRAVVALSGGAEGGEADGGGLRSAAVAGAKLQEASVGRALQAKVAVVAGGWIARRRSCSALRRAHRCHTLRLVPRN